MYVVFLQLMVKLPVVLLYSGQEVTQTALLNTESTFCTAWFKSHMYKYL